MSDEEDLDLDLAVEPIVRRRRLARGLRAAARRALRLARRYRFEEAPRCPRELACVAQALAWRKAACELMAGKELGPGLARATSLRAPASSKKTA